ncbi:zeta toxin family protein [Pseudomonas sp. TH41]|uniref:zeta toxin family protein n=1 Tax=Pseudomonas sp. TH41 TaxID=2796405 RepID=UPI0019145DE0|nr:zeta toxin family protein [Pseudomonas sp. TH41]MBK5352022.1 zeta toxin family protein [Pseudomonas sp. TH41]
MGVSLDAISAPLTRAISGQEQREGNLPEKVVSVLNRSNSFHELRQVPVSADPRKVEPLSDEGKKQLLANAIEKLAGNANPKEEPVVYIITGQMGAGKSTVTNNISAKLDGDCLVIDYDELKQFVPGYTEEASKGYPGTVPGCKEPARYLVEGLRAHGFEKRLNMVIQESINSTSDGMLNLAVACKENNYHVSLTILAVDKATSNVGMLSRYESALRNIKLGDVPPSGAWRTLAAYHEDAYQSLTVPEKFEELVLSLDEVIVSGRNGHAYYQSSTDFTAEEIVKAIEAGRGDVQGSRLELFNNLSGAVRFNADHNNPELRN